MAGQAVALPAKRPLTAPLAAQVPAFLASGGDPKEFVRALEGKGTFATASSSLADVASHISPVLGEAVNLPATVLPSAFLTGKAGLNAAKGDPAELDALLKQWEETGLLPALAKGDTGAALKALENQPLYSALEASGAASVLGRGAGTLARGATGDRLGGLARPDLPILGTPINIKRRYSRDLVRQGIQRAFDHIQGARSHEKGDATLQAVLDHLDEAPPLSDEHLQALLEKYRGGEAQTGQGRRGIRADTFRGRHYLKEAPTVLKPAKRRSAKSTFTRTCGP